MEIFFIALAILAFIAVCVGVAIYKVDAEEKRTNQLKDFLLGRNFNVTAIELIGGSALAIDEQNEKVCIITEVSSDEKYEVLDFDDIVGVEIIEDGNSISKTSSTSAIGKAAVGGALLGPAGMVVGGLMGKKINESTISKLVLRLTVNSISQPTKDFTFLNTEVKRGSLTHQQCEKSSSIWKGRFDVIIKKCDSKRVQNQNTTVVINFPSLNSIYVFKNGQNFGPYDFNQLNSYIQQGAFSLTDQVCHNGQNWTLISDFYRSANLSLPT